MGGKWKPSSTQLIEKFYACMEDFPDAEKRKMFGYPCCFVNGNMFTGLHEENWIVRLDENDRQELIDSYRASIFEPMKGRPMREYVALPISILTDLKLLHTWIDKALAFTSSKPVKVRKKARKTRAVQ